MKLLLNTVLFLIVLFLVCRFGLNMFSVIRPVKSEKLISEGVSDAIHDGYNSAVFFVMNAQYTIVHSESFKDAVRWLRVQKEKLSNRNNQSAEDLKKITPESLGESFK